MTGMNIKFDRQGEYPQTLCTLCCTLEIGEVWD